ncbi:hypothetical protein BG000_003999 [Podila horticola]|nr:hypothetical protein BG000_003999 [Podila horticola]
MLWGAMQDYFNRFTTIPPGDLPQQYTAFTPDKITFLETQLPTDGTYVMIELAYTSKEEYARNFEQYYPNARRTTRGGVLRRIPNKPKSETISLP